MRDFADTAEFIAETAREAYETLLWSEGVSNGSEVHESVHLEVYQAVMNLLYVDSARAIIDGYGLSPTYVGHNLILSGNRHGTGFWDNYSTGLTDEDAATLHNYSTGVEVYAGDDGVYYAM